MATRVRIANEGPHHIIVGTPTQRAFLRSGVAETMEVSEHHPIVVTEYESDMNELGTLVLPEGFKQ
jgi:hypothetical protein